MEKQGGTTLSQKERDSQSPNCSQISPMVICAILIREVPFFKDLLENSNAEGMEKKKQDYYLRCDEGRISGPI